MGEKGRVWFMAWSSRRFNWFDLCGGGAERCQKNTFCTRFEIKTGEFGRKPETEILHNCKFWGMIDKCKMHFQGLCKGSPELKLKYVTKTHFRKCLRRDVQYTHHSRLRKCTLVSQRGKYGDPPHSSEPGGAWKEASNFNSDKIFERMTFDINFSMA